MTKQSFIGQLIKALQLYTSLPEEEYKSPLSDAKILMLYNTNEKKSGMWDQYLIMKLKDGTSYRITPERILQFKDHEKNLLDEINKEIDTDDDVIDE